MLKEFYLWGLLLMGYVLKSWRKVRECDKWRKKGGASKKLCNLPGRRLVGGIAGTSRKRAVR